MLCLAGSVPGVVGLTRDPQPRAGLGAGGAAVERSRLSASRF